MNEIFSRINSAGNIHDNKICAVQAYYHTLRTKKSYKTLMPESLLLSSFPCSRCALAKLFALPCFLLSFTALLSRK